MTGIARETLDLWREGISPSLSLLIPTFAFPCAPAYITIRIQRTVNAPLPILLLFAIPRLRYLPYPRLLSMRGPSTSELLRTL